MLLSGFRSRKAALASIVLMGGILIGATVTNLVAGLVGDAMVPLVVLILAAVLLYLRRDVLNMLRITRGLSLSTSK